MLHKWICMFIGLSLASCYKQAATSLLHEESLTETYVEDCQTLLSPSGYPEKNMYPEVVFTQRSCRGTAKAVTKSVRAKTVVVVSGDGSSEETQLFAKDKDVLVATDSGLRLIGSLHNTNEGLELGLQDAIFVELKVGSSAENLKVWEPGDNTVYKVEVIYVYL